jgi:hypothetical protein
MPVRRPVVLGVFLAALVALCPSTSLAQKVGRSRVLRVSLENVELHLADVTSIAPAGSVTVRPGASTAELRLGLAEFDVASEDFRQTGYRKAAALPAYCPVGWWHMHLGTVPCPREALAACTTICWAHPYCSATLSWTAFAGLCQDSCNCDPDGSP